MSRVTQPRRLGTPAVARLSVTVPVSDTVTTIPAGTAFTTDADLTGGESFTFVTNDDINIPAGESLTYVAVSSQYVGSVYNAPANSITGVSATTVDGIVVTNPQPATGGSDVETYQEVQERFFTLIRRRNPVSADDWQDFFTDFYGVGTQTSVQPNRPNQGTYNYVSDYLKPNGQVSFFVLGPDGVELNKNQLERGQNVVNYSVPVENQGHLYPITLSPVQYDLTVEVDTNGTFGENLKDSSLNFRDRLFQVLQPGNVFPADSDPTVSNVDSAFYSTFDVSTRFSDPVVKTSAAYNTPPLLEPGAATYTNVYTFERTGTLLDQYDLVETTLPIPTFYPVTSGFTPYSADKQDQTIYGNLSLQQIKYLAPDEYLRGQVAYWDPALGGDGELHVILGNLSVDTQSDIPGLIANGEISPAMVYSSWTVGNSYTAITGSVYAPEIVEYDYVSGDSQFIPDPTSLVPLNKRPGAFVWVVSQNFTLNPSTNTVSSASGQSLLGAPIVPKQLTEGTTYAAGDWVFTPQIGSGPNPTADPFFNYVDIRLGVVNKYAQVKQSFTYAPDGKAISIYFDDLVLQEIVQEVQVQNGDTKLAIYKYKPRFPALTYLEYRADSAAAPEYFIAATFFTPTSTDAQELLNQGLILPLYNSNSQYLQLTSGIATQTVKLPTRMFRFFKGDRTFFRQGTQVLSYTATTAVHPLFEFYIYLENGVFVETARYTTGQFEFSEYIPYFNPAYVEYSEDTILSIDNRSLYRVMRAFTPATTDVNWTGTTVANTARIEEYKGNLLRYVDQYFCDEPILSQLGRDVSAIKLGIAQITIIPRNSGRFGESRPKSVFVWESTATLPEVPQLSWYSGTTYAYNPPKYGEGTLKL